MNKIETSVSKVWFDKKVCSLCEGKLIKHGLDILTKIGGKVKVQNCTLNYFKVPYKIFFSFFL